MKYPDSLLFIAVVAAGEQKRSATEGFRVATTEELLAVVGSSVDSPAVRAMVAANALIASADEDLEEGEPVRAYLSNPRDGYQLMHHSGRVATAFLFVEPAVGFAAFTGPLPGGLDGGASRSQVRARFGTPERSGEPFTSPFLGRQGAWDRFLVNGVHVHFQYNEPEQRVRLVSIMAAGDAP